MTIHRVREFLAEHGAVALAPDKHGVCANCKREREP